MVVVVEVTVRDGIDDVYDERQPTLSLLPRYLIPLGNNSEDFIVKDRVDVRSEGYYVITGVNVILAEPIGCNVPRKKPRC